jgi:hypothetical protein
MQPWRRLLASIVVVSLAGCYDFHLTGPEDAPAVSGPGFVSVAIEYRQPNGCLGPHPDCDQPVIFSASWMRPGAEFRLTREPGGYVWRGVAHNVPVNYPPRDDPYAVRVFDPHLLLSCAEGYSADRISVGGEALTRWDGGGCRDQHALVYIDQNGRGRNPY